MSFILVIIKAEFSVLALSHDPSEIILILFFRNFLYIYTYLFKSMFYFIQQVCIKLIKSDSKEINIVANCF